MASARRSSTSPAARELPVAECRLDLAGLREQRDRYRALQAHVERLERDRGRLRVSFSTGVARGRIAEAVAVERECCPFFVLSYDESRRRLTVTVEDERQEAALDALRFAFESRG